MSPLTEKLFVIMFSDQKALGFLDRGLVVERRSNQINGYKKYLLKAIDMKMDACNNSGVNKIWGQSQLHTSRFPVYYSKSRSEPNRNLPRLLV